MHKVLFVLLFALFTHACSAGLAVRYLYENIAGNNISSLRSSANFPGNPQAAQVLTNGLEVGSYTNDNFGSFTRGYLEAPQTGDYTFVISGDDHVQLWICLNPTLPNPERHQLTLVAHCDAPVSPRAYHARKEQRSGKITLEKAKRYYFEILHKAAGGEDHFSVGWELPNKTQEFPILSRHLIPFPVDPENGYRYRENVRPTILTPLPVVTFNPPPAPAVNPPDVPTLVLPQPPAVPPASAINRYPGVIGQPTPIPVLEGSSLTFEVSYESTLPLAAQWRWAINSLARQIGTQMNLAGEDLSYLTLDFVNHFNSPAEYWLRIQTQGLGTTNTLGMFPLAIIPDTTAPTLLSARTLGNRNGIILTFSEYMTVNPDDPLRVNDPKWYSLDQGAAVQGVTMINPRTYLLATSDLNEGLVYKLSVQQVRDRASMLINANPSAPTNMNVLQVQGLISRKIYEPIYGNNPGILEAHPSFQNDQPTEHAFEPSMEYPPLDQGGWRNHYGVRLQGYVTAPVSGEYIFAICASDPALLYLSSSDDPTKKTLLAFEVAGAPKRAFANAGPSQNLRDDGSGEPLNMGKETLVAGKKYYIEAVMLESTGEDHLSVTWQKPGDPAIANGAAPIGADYLSSMKSVGPVTIVGEPADIELPDYQEVTFQVEADGAPPYTYQWYRDGEAIPNATSASYRFLAHQFDGGAVFHCVVSNYFSGANSRVANLVMTPTPPSVVSAGGLVGSRELVIRFNEPVDSALALDPANYEVGTPPVVIDSLTMGDEEKMVVLKLAAPVTQTSLPVKILQLDDRHQNKSANVQVQARFFPMISQDIGATGDPAIPGSVLTSDGQRIHMRGSGSDIWGNADGFHFLYSERKGDFDVKVRVARLSAVNRYSKAGLMIRETLQPGSKNHVVAVTPHGQTEDDAFDGAGADFVEANMRPATGAASQRWVGTPPSQSEYVSFPQAWLRLQREGNTLRCYTSLNGKSWDLLAEQTSNYPETALVGLCLTAHNNVKAATAEFFDFVDTMQALPLTLSISQVGDQVQLEWEELGAILETTLSLTPPISWTPIPNSNAAQSITLPAGLGTGFFRLRK